MHVSTTSATYGGSYTGPVRQAAPARPKAPNPTTTEHTQRENPPAGAPPSPIHAAEVKTYTARGTPHSSPAATGTRLHATA